MPTRAPTAHKTFTDTWPVAVLVRAEASRQQSASWDGSLAAVRREFLEKLQLMHSDLQQVFALDTGVQAQRSLLADRVAGLEDQAARWAVGGAGEGGHRRGNPLGALMVVCNSRQAVESWGSVFCHRRLVSGRME